ncbi:hypothetical protein BC937DRAFT_86785 [Endogone sp. FLAS-F59071]|nr:hypothetical protein BC937DRAFT_86785 [Endogone sp. FLAS-F59071]|eukprot:RUS19880.1 hypothetical protein BC937DRAFT_86785 [Endogone sp. FLAS-F59071]
MSDPSKRTLDLSRKRKWDLDDHGQTAPPPTDVAPSPNPKIAKVSETASPSPPTTSGDATVLDPNVAASVAAAKINAMLAEKGIQIPVKLPQVIVPEKKDENKIPEAPGKEHKPSSEEFVKDIPINDIKNRYLLTKGATQSQIQKDTGADVTTRGKYYPEKHLASEEHPPLYLHVTAVSQESLDAAVAKIEELIEQASNPSPVTTRGPPPGLAERPTQPRQFLQTKVFVGIDPDRSFNVRAKIVGPQGAYVKHIQSETGAKVQLKGRGSGFVEPTSGTEAFEPLHLHITCYQQEGLDRAQKLSEDLVNTVKVEYERTRQERGQYGSGYGRPSQNRQSQYGAGYGVPPPPPGVRKIYRSLDLTSPLIYTLNNLIHALPPVLQLSASISHACTNSTCQPPPPTWATSSIQHTTAAPT